MKHISYILFIVLLAFITGCAEDPTMPDNIINADPPEVETISPVPPEDIKATEATIYGKVKNENGSPITERGFVWYDNLGQRDSSSLITYDEETKIFKYTIKGLTNNHEYIFKAFARNEAEKSYGNEVVFNTNPGLVQVETKEVIERRSTSALVAGKITYKGEGEILERGVYYSSMPFTPENTAIYLVKSEMEADSFTCNIPNLKEETTYYIKAYVKNGFGEAKGGEKSFVTTDGTPEIISFEIENITTDEVTFKAEVNSNEENAPITIRGFCYGLNEYPEIGGEGVKEIDGGSGNGVFTADTKEVEPQVEYYVRAYAMNDKGLKYSEPISFILKSSLATIKTIKPEDADFGNGTVNVRGEILSSGEGNVLEAGFLWSTVPDPTREMVDNLTVWYYDTWDGTGGNSIKHQVKELTGSRLYYLRTYVRNEYGASYGKSEDVPTPDIFSPITAFNGNISVPGSGSYVEYKNFGYLIGGEDAGNSPTDQMWEFNKSDKKWRRRIQLPRKRSWMAVANTTTALFLFGGLDENKQPTNNVYYWSISDDNNSSWLESNNPGPAPTFGSFGTLFNGMLVIGGVQQSSLGHNDSIVADVWELDIIKNLQWDQRSQFPEPQYGGFAFTVTVQTRKTIFAGLGKNSVNANTSSNNFWSSTDNGSTWDEKKKMPGNGVARAGVLLDTGQIYTTKYIYIVDNLGYIHRYDVWENQWVTKSRLPAGSRDVHCMYTDGKLIYIGLGDNANQLWVYDPSWDN